MNKFFLVGCPRSGTTVLQQALNRHSRIVIPPETSFFFLPGFPRLDQNAHLRRINRELGIELPMPPRVFDSSRSLRSCYEQMARLYVQKLGRSGATHFGEKSPEHQLRIPQILEAFPDAKILLLYRDGRDVALSLCKVPWMFSDLYLNFYLWLHYYRTQRKLTGPVSFPIHFVRYERLVSAPEEELQKVLEFLALPWEPQVAQGHGNREGILQREYWKTGALERITTARIGTWQRELSERDIRYLERWGGTALRSLGYELLTPGDAALPWLFFPRMYMKIALWLARQPRSRIARETVRQAIRKLKDCLRPSERE